MLQLSNITAKSPANLSTIAYFYIKKIMKPMDSLYIFSNGRVAAINKKDGSITWEIRLKEYISSSTAHHVGQLMLEGSKLYVGVEGVLLCLNAKDGSLVWKNELKGWGYNFVSIGNAGNEAGAAAMAQAASNSAAVTAATS
jgi:outer membrane protein assembly factor BamB